MAAVARNCHVLCPYVFLLPPCGCPLSRANTSQRKPDMTFRFRAFACVPSFCECHLAQTLLAEYQHEVPPSRNKLPRHPFPHVCPCHRVNPLARKCTLKKSYGHDSESRGAPPLLLFNQRLRAAPLFFLVLPTEPRGHHSACAGVCPASRSNTLSKKKSPT